MSTQSPFDDRADARDLVDLDRHGDVALRHLDVLDLARRALEHLGGDGLALDDVSPRDLADDQALELDAVRREVDDRNVRFLDVAVLDDRPEVDVSRRDDDGGRRGLCGGRWATAVAVHVTRINTNAMSARKIPISRTNRFERFN
jgi:hypothetical protein